LNNIFHKRNNKFANLIFIIQIFSVTFFYNYITFADLNNYKTHAKEITDSTVKMEHNFSEFFNLKLDIANGKLSEYQQNILLKNISNNFIDVLNSLEKLFILINKNISLNKNNAKDYFLLANIYNAKYQFSLICCKLENKYSKYFDKFPCDQKTSYIFFNEAIENLNKSIKLEPKKSEYYIYRGNMFLKYKGDLKTALDNFQLAVKYNPKDNNIYENIANNFLLQKNDEQALLWFNKAIEVNPHSFNAFYNRAMIYHGKKLYHKAIIDYKRVLKINPKFKPAKYALQLSQQELQKH
jgi:tetratricopeptide (TPR) repeat protein